VVATGNFHGRTTTVISFSDDETARRFGPYTPGFRTVPYGDSRALAAAIDEPAWCCRRPATLPDVRELCSSAGVLFVADEIQSGLPRTGSTLACEHFGVVPDGYLLGKALGGGVVPLSAVVADSDVHGVAAVRGVGLWAGVDIDPAYGTGRASCERLLARGVLAKDTHGADPPGPADRRRAARAGLGRRPAPRRAPGGRLTTGMSAGCTASAPQ
jgi:ornithine--oxo-acid transaminase